MNRYLIIAGISAALAAPTAYAFGWNDVKNAADDVAHGFERGWEKIEDSVQTEDAEEKREEAAEARSEAAERRADGRKGTQRDEGT